MTDSKRSTDFYEYRDADLVLRVPSCLRAKKGIPFFAAQSEKDRRDPLLHFGIGVLDEYPFEALRETMMRRAPGESDECLGVHRRVIRRGGLPHLTEGIELLTSSRNSTTGQVHHGYRVLFRLGPRRLFADFFGQGEIGPFEEVCRQILSSIRPAEGGAVAPASPKRGRVAGAMPRADKMRLKTTLDGLPQEIAYLRRPILSLANEDQDLLASGGADVEGVGRALERNVAPELIQLTAKAHAQILREWLMSLPDHNGAWSGSAWFVEGVLQGRAIWS